MTAVEDRLAEIESRDLLPCGACDGGLPMACACGDPRASLSLTTDALRAVLALHRKGLVYALTDECGHDHSEDDSRVGRDEYDDPFCLDSPTGEAFCTGCIASDEGSMPWPCETVRAIAAALGVTP